MERLTCDELFFWVPFTAMILGHLALFTEGTFEERGTGGELRNAVDYLLRFVEGRG